MEYNGEQVSPKKPPETSCVLRSKHQPVGTPNDIEGTGMSMLNLMLNNILERLNDVESTVGKSIGSLADKLNLMNDNIVKSQHEVDMKVQEIDNRLKVVEEAIVKKDRRASDLAKKRWEITLQVLKYAGIVGTTILLSKCGVDSEIIKNVIGP